MEIQDLYQLSTTLSWCRAEGKLHHHLSFTLELDAGFCGGNFDPYSQKTPAGLLKHLFSPYSYCSCQSHIVEQHWAFSPNDAQQGCKSSNCARSRSSISLTKPYRVLTHTEGINVSIYWWETWISRGFFFPPSGQVSRQHHKSNNLSAALCIDRC